MATETKQTWDEMKKMYPDQWLEIVDFETGNYDEIVRGVVGLVEVSQVPEHRDIP